MVIKWYWNSPISVDVVDVCSFSLFFLAGLNPIHDSSRGFIFSCLLISFNMRSLRGKASLKLLSFRSSGMLKKFHVLMTEIRNYGVPFSWNWKVSYLEVDMSLHFLQIIFPSLFTAVKTHCSQETSPQFSTKGARWESTNRCNWYKN